MRQEQLLTLNLESTMGGQGDLTGVGVDGKSLGEDRLKLLFNLNQNGSREDTDKLADSKLEIDRCYSWLNVQAEELPAGKRSRRSSETSYSSSTSSLPMPTAPDGGWGWFVVFGAFTISFICDGISYGFGVIYAELLVQFGASHSQTSMVGSIFYGVAMLLGPVASALTTRFGCRTITIIGAVISSIGFFLSSFATSIEMLCITFSTIVGIGFSFCYITSVVIVAFYFNKRRSLATGLAVCGTGVGTFVFAPLMDFFILEFGWRGMFLIMSGVCLNLIVCGLLFRPLEFTEGERWQMLLQEFNKIPHSREDIELLRSRFPSDSSECPSDEECLEEEARTLSMLSLPTFVNTDWIQAPSCILMEALKNSRNPHHTLQRYMKNAMLQIDNNSLDLSHRKDQETDVGSPVDETRSQSQVCSTSSSDSAQPTCQLSQCLHLTEKKVKDVWADLSPTQRGSSLPGDKVLLQKNMQTKLVQGVPTNSTTGDHASHKRHEFSGMSGMLTDKGCEKEGRSVVKRVSGVHMGRHNALGIHLPLYRTDIFYRRLLRNNSQRACTLGTSCPELTESVAPESKRNIVIQKLSGCLEESCDMMKSMLDLRLFLNPFFAVFVTSNFIYYFWDDVPYMYAADHAMNIGVDQQKASFIISIIGIFNTVGQVVFGFVGDMQVNLLNVYAVISTLAALFVAAIPLMKTYLSLAACYGLFGFFIAVSFPLTTALLVNNLGMSKLTNAYGMLMLVQGVANFLGPPFAGWVTDKTGNYDAAFYLSGFFYTVSGLLLFLVYLPRCVRILKGRRSSLDMTTSVHHL